MVLLESNKFLRELSAAELDALRGATREMNFAPGQPIFRQGDPGEGIYFVKEGLVLISITIGHGDSKVLTKVAPGDVFGEMVILDNSPRFVSATAEQATTVYFISSAELQHLLERMPRLTLALAREIVRRARNDSEQYVRAILKPQR
jgi:CRP-like cAMP-binding protein